MDDEGNANADDEPNHDGSRAKVWGRYLAWHARKQLAFG
jgi:Trk/Ktr/HKT type cation transporter